MEKKLGFGCMRLPMKNGEVDQEQFCQMIDQFMKEGFHYFDTAHGYLQGKSEPALRECLVKRYPRDSFILTNKLTKNFFHKKEDIIPLFEQQLKQTGVDYFDYYLMHAQDREIYKHFQKCEAYEVARQLKAQGKIRHVGISFHDSAEVLEMILNEHPEIEIVQIQFNYADYEDASVQSRKVYEVCCRYNKPVLIMEPVKGGGLVNLPDEAKAVFDRLNGGSYASYAIRFAASFDGVYKVLSGMSNLDQLNDNISFMKEFQPFQKAEYEAVQEVAEILKKMGGIACTACRYCVDGCPQHISIPDLFSCYNAKKQFNDWNSDYYYGVYTKTKGKASQCIGCRQCERICPQHLKIVDYLKEVAQVFE
ncbi:aldo/keto reductase [[Clostridium] spiroforme]|nr:aldo/keto reductase [Thomasclavelia spiroformis]